MPQSFSDLPRTPPRLYSPSRSQRAYDPSPLHTPLANFARAPDPFPCFPAAIAETPTSPRASSYTPLPDLPPDPCAISPCSRCSCLPTASEFSFRVARCAASCIFPFVCSLGLLFYIFHIQFLAPVLAFSSDEYLPALCIANTTH
ncbi:hypothetical protein KFK09_014260 [Dendrobium nobile]|uniref:Uncharacterized protein n=1 Tax=Dendrobium nobile TaxID=94219 RepID=A0A8T3BCG1_DENNO|nr:hypothetical protein KFK09_014260 [Dendrobium nobile]